MAQSIRQSSAQPRGHLEGYPAVDPRAGQNEQAEGYLSTGTNFSRIPSCCRFSRFHRRPRPPRRPTVVNAVCGLKCDASGSWTKSATNKLLEKWSDLGLSESFL